MLQDVAQPHSAMGVDAAVSDCSELMRWSYIGSV